MLAELPPLAHIDAKSIDEAIHWLTKYGDRAAVIAGGTDLLGLMKDRITGPKMPQNLTDAMEESVTSKPEVIDWLKRSLEAVRVAHLAVKPADLARKVHIQDRDATVDGIYLRIIIHANEHMGQLVAYARMTGVVPPWSK